MKDTTYNRGLPADNALKDKSKWFCWRCGEAADVWLRCKLDNYPWIWFACNGHMNEYIWMTTCEATKLPITLSIQVIT